MAERQRSQGWNGERIFACVYLCLVVLLVLRVRTSRVVVGTEGVTVRPPGRTVRLRWAEVERFEHGDSKWDFEARLGAVLTTGERKRFMSPRLEGEYARELVGDLNTELAERTAGRRLGRTPKGPGHDA